MNDELPASAQRVQAALEKAGVPLRVIEMAATTRTAQDAATAIGCDVGQIAKSLLFRGEKSGKPILVIASGTNRVNEKILSGPAGEPLGKASADFVREKTGYAIGGVPPIGFPEPIETWIDQDLLQYEEVWAAAGTPFAVFSLVPTQLADLTAGTVIRIC